MLRESHEPTCHFIITLTSHTPYKFVTPTEDYPYPHPANNAENYFNHMRYLDDCLQRLHHVASQAHDGRHLRRSLHRGADR